MLHDRELFLSLLRCDFRFFISWAFSVVRPGKTFQPYWFLDAIAHELDLVRQGKTRRLLVTLPPRSLKSTLISVIFAAWWLLHNPSGRIICVSYSELLARALARDCRRLLEHPTLREAFPAFRIDRRKNAENELTTTRNGFRFATSVSGTLTGKGADMLLLDDLLSAGDANSEAIRTGVNEFIDGPLISRLDDQSRGQMILVAQRLHSLDPPGHLLAKGGWQHLNLPARNTGEPRQIATGPRSSYLWKPDEDLMPDTLNRAEQDRLLRDMGQRNFAAQYLQEPLPPGGNIFKLEWLKTYAAPLVSYAYSRIVVSVDVANKIGAGNDFSVAVVLGVTRDHHYHVLRVYRVQLEFPNLRELALQLVSSWKPSHVLIEDAANGTGLYQEIRYTSGTSFIPIKPKGDKESRAQSTTPVFEQGRLLLPEAADWLAEYVREITGFPNTVHDDQVDATVQALIWLEELRRNQPPTINFIPILRPGSSMADDEPDERW